MSIFLGFLVYIFRICTTYYQGGRIWEIIRKIKRPVKVQKARKIVSNNKFKSDFDTLGSYTGVDAYDKYEKPVQDADDL